MRRLRESLSTQILTILGGTFALIAVVGALVMTFVIWPTFLDLESNEARRNSARVVGALMNEIDKTSRTAGDWAYWDDSYAFAKGNNATYPDDNLYFDALRTINQNLVAIYGADGRLIVQRAYDLGTGEMLQVPELAADLPAASPLAASSSVDGVTSGIIETDHGLMLVAARNVLTSAREGPPAGRFVMGRLLSEKVVADLRAQLDLQFTLSLRPASDFPALADARESAIESRPVLDGSKRDVISATVALPLLLRKNLLILQTDTPRGIAATGRTAVMTSIAISALAMLCVLAVLWALLRRVVVSPLRSLKDHVTTAGNTGTLGSQAPSDRTDEIGILVRQFDTTFAHLAEVRQKLLEQSHLAGMSEVATDVIHNLRNALSPITVALGLVRNNVATGDIDKLQRALAEVGAPDMEAERREKLLRFATLSAQKLRDRRDETLAELQRIAAQAEHVEQILEAQNRHTRKSRPLEPVSLHDIVSSNARFIERRNEVPIAVVIDGRLSALPPVLGDAVLLPQIVNNILLNAAESIEQAKVPQGRIDVSAEIETVDGRRVLRLMVRDNGAGMSGEVLQGAFHRGFSTKRKTNGGLGLHWCANSISAMAGRIWAESDGVGQGATFYVILPIASTIAQAAE